MAEAASSNGAACDALVAALEDSSAGKLSALLPALLKALPEDAQERCLMCLRDAIVEELQGGVLDDDEGGVNAFKAALAGDAAGSAVAANHEILQPSDKAEGGVGAAKKRPFRAMAAPFLKTAPTSAGGATSSSAPAPAAVDTSASGDTSAAPPTSVYAANIPYDATEAAIREFFTEKCGAVTSVRILSLPSGSPKGAVVLTFETSEAATKALELDGTPGLSDRILIVKEDQRATSKGDGKSKKGRLHRAKEPLQKDLGDRPRSGKGGAKSSAPREGDERSVVVKNLAFSATEAHLGELFAGCGEIKAVRIAKDSRSGRSKGFAVVEFSDAAAVKKALERDGNLVKGRACRVEAMAGELGCRVEAMAGELGAEDNEVVESNMESQSDKVQAPADEPKTDAEAVPAQAVEAAETPPPKKRQRGAPSSTTAQETAYASGADGLKEAATLIEEHGASKESLLQAVGADALKGRLAALGLKSGGVPLDRAERFLRLRGLSRVEDLPGDLTAKVKGRDITEGLLMIYCRRPLHYVRN
eukprot:TRINITY_DN23754_c0_g2_i2.p1 TRINITY_DN23754_c0_g2~~TRINITY_DN23754_c0_g2_i2.p1  ORF type:complete len:532 (+),score=105.82 TRINITY_DN23754_c0_g2_i2:58-1653(+)